MAGAQSATLCYLRDTLQKPAVDTLTRWCKQAKGCRLQPAQPRVKSQQERTYQWSLASLGLQWISTRGYNGDITTMTVDLLCSRLPGLLGPKLEIVKDQAKQTELRFTDIAQPASRAGKVVAFASYSFRSLCLKKPKSSARHCNLQPCR